MRAAARAWLIVAVACCAGCASAPKRDATEALIARPDFRPAAQAAPEWVRAALREITRLESELQRK